MIEQPTPRQRLKAWLRGEPLPQPLFMPIFFSLGARLGNLPLRDFQSNPTKIANAMRQIRVALKVDGLAAYFDPYLEGEALGCTREWHADGSCTLRCPGFDSMDGLRRTWTPSDSLKDKSPVRIACDVLQRTKAMLKDEPVLMVRVSGPFTLASQLAGQPAHELSSLSQDLVECAAEVTASVARNFVEAGADIVLLAEDVVPEMSAERCSWWASLLAPVINVVRFYNAAPVLLLGPAASSQENCAVILNRSWECVLCPAVSNAEFIRRFLAQSGDASLGLAVPADLFCSQDDAISQGLIDHLSEPISNRRLVVLTSVGDIPSGADMTHLSRTLIALRKAFPIPATLP